MLTLTTGLVYRYIHCHGNPPPELPADKSLYNYQLVKYDTPTLQIEKYYQILKHAGFFILLFNVLQKLYRGPTVSKKYFLLDCLKIIITANLLLLSFTYLYTSRNSTYDVTLSERRVGACRSSRKKNTLYIILYFVGRASCNDSW